MSLAVIILAAGNSTRMQSKISKIFHPLGGKPLISYVLEASRSANPTQIIIVCGEENKNHPLFSGCTVVVQNPPLGTGHAVSLALPALNTDIERVLILSGDVPTSSPSLIQKLAEVEKDIGVVGMLLEPHEISLPYGRLICDPSNAPLQNIEFKDASPKQKLSPLANGGIYSVRSQALKEITPFLQNNNKAGEFYLPDIIALGLETSHSRELVMAKHEEVRGVNSRQDLAKAAEVLQKKWREMMMAKGVTLYDPSSVVLSPDTQAGQDTIIHSFVAFGPNVTMEEDVTIFSHCYLEDCHIKAGAKIGPFAHIRGGSRVDEKAEIGNFVEVKKSHFKAGAKAKHLSYIGDATVGEKSNIGAGTITANYDGVNKHATQIGKAVKVGANSSLVAPLNIGDGATIGAGSTITEDVPSGSLALGRARQVVKPPK
jgi:bifunctional UDP-N-acetylglucosamine pyrophosphorylase/glucosamine-1-phosphate N-acetyltransferase